MEKQNILGLLREIYVEKRLDLLKRSHAEWEKTQEKFLAALKANKDLKEIEAKMEALEWTRRAVEAKVREQVDYNELYSDFVDKVEKKLVEVYSDAREAVKKLKDHEQEKCKAVSEFRRADVFSGEGQELAIVPANSTSSTNSE
jgi:hypothetical protein